MVDAAQVFGGPCWLVPTLLLPSCEMGASWPPNPPAAVASPAPS